MLCAVVVVVVVVSFHLPSYGFVCGDCALSSFWTSGPTHWAPSAGYMWNSFLLLLFRPKTTVAEREDCLGTFLPGLHARLFSNLFLLLLLLLLFFAFLFLSNYEFKIHFTPDTKREKRETIIENFNFSWLGLCCCVAVPRLLMMFDVKLWFIYYLKLHN